MVKNLYHYLDVYCLLVFADIDLNHIKICNSELDDNDLASFFIPKRNVNRGLRIITNQHDRALIDNETLYL